MATQLKPISEQVMVITGASSGIGRATAELAARQGAKLVLVARDASALESLDATLTADGAEAISCAVDVGKQESHDQILTVAMERFGRVDTWVNNAGVSIFGKLDQVSLEDQRQLFETNFWGVVYGSLKALSVLREHGGALINLGSEVSDVALPLQGAYAASKHAVKGYTDALRMEIEGEGLPVSVTLIKPASIDTSFVQNAKNYMDVEPRLPSPLYAPETVARAIVYAAEHPQRDIYVGSASKMTSAFARRMPKLTDLLLGPVMRSQQRSDTASGQHEGALYAPRQDAGGRLNEPRMVRSRSYYTTLTTTGRPFLWGAAAVLAVSAVAASAQHRRRR